MPGGVRSILLKFNRLHAYRESIGLVALVVGERKVPRQSAITSKIISANKTEVEFRSMGVGGGMLYESFPVAEQDEGKNHAKKTRAGGDVKHRRGDGWQGR